VVLKGEAVVESLTGAITVFVAAALFVVLAGIGLARFGDELAEKTGWGTLWVGTLLVSIATSLPELTVNISAVWLEDNPDLALGNVFGANMINVFVLATVALLFGVKNVFENQGKDTQILVLLGIGLVLLAAVMGASGDVKLGPTSLGGLLLLVAYFAGMRAVYQAGRTEMHLDDVPSAKGSARNAWIGFGISAAVVIVAGRFLASSADDIAQYSGISASFIGVLLVAIVTTLPEGSVTVAAAFRKSYGIVIGNVYGSCAFNVAIFFFADLFHTKGPMLGVMGKEHFVAAVAAIVLMGMGYLIIQACQKATLGWAQKLAPAIPVVYIGALYLVFVLGQQ
jgi:cation:H+ antiporter